MTQDAQFFPRNDAGEYSFAPVRTRGRKSNERLRDDFERYEDDFTPLETRQLRNDRRSTKPRRNDRQDYYPGDNRSGNGRERRVMKSMNFENYAAEGNRFIRELAEELDSDRNHAARVFRAVLHAVRDRIPPDEAIQFAQGLPMILKGVFLDQYDISKTPVIIRNREKFIDYIYYKCGFSAPRDFPTRQSVIDALGAVFTVLENNMDYRQVEEVKEILHQDIVDMIDSYHGSADYTDPERWL